MFLVICNKKQNNKYSVITYSKCRSESETNTYILNDVLNDNGTLFQPYYDIFIWQMLTFK